MRGIRCAAVLLVVALVAASSADATVVKLRDSGMLPEWVGDLNAFYGGQAGYTSSIVAPPVTAGDLAGVDLLVGWLPTADFTAAELTALSGYLGGGGRILFLGENGSFPTENNRINAALSGLGSGMSIDNVTIDSLFHDATVANGQILAHPLMDGVSTLNYAAPSTITGGDTFVVGTDLVSPFGASELLLGGGIVLLSDVNVVNNVNDPTNDNDVFFLNVAEWEMQDVIPEPATLSLLALGGLGLLARRRRRR